MSTPEPGPAEPAAAASAGAAEGAVRATPLRAVHERLGASMTAFAGWLMPLRYRSETAEHQAVRNAAGLFDLSHMGEIAVTGAGAAGALDYALVGNMSALAPGRARYTMICAPDGGVLDDLIVYRLADAEYLLIPNAANTALAPLTDINLDGVKYYASHRGTVAGRPVLLARTGYTGEDGFELFTAAADAEAVWTALAAAGADDGLVPAGLAARDTLRLEAGMPLYGNELSAQVTPFDAGLGRVVVFDKPGDFVGRAALAERAQAPARQVLAGLIGGSRRVPRHGYPVIWDGVSCGTVTSGAPSPTLAVPIAMAYLDPEAASRARDDTEGRLAVDVRGRPEPAKITDLPFYRRPR